MTARRDDRRLEAPFTNSPVQRLLTDPQEPRRFLRGDQTRESAGRYLRLLREKAVMPSWSDHSRVEQPPCHGTQHRRPAHAQAGG